MRHHEFNHWLEAPLFPLTSSWTPATCADLAWPWVPIGPRAPKKTLSLPAFLHLVCLLLLPLPLSSHLLQLLSVFPLDEALLMSHLWEVIWYGERQSGKQREVDQGEQIKRETRRQGCEDTRSVSNWARTAIYVTNCTDSSFHSKCCAENVAGRIAAKLPLCCYFINNGEVTRN